ncbi:MAG TPA: hypothetical protein VL547_07740 [Dinghuibacter sp.]|uniref:hypothetical protein n=1 Tax=Dinghuibacter sp. TaxID=2024697 RepID=UPI002CD08D41|nr:hypothetical protein [Dinghuibacter sp.]HTJ11900.1 hypothetical protein [Dinghuibacter sp.]
MDNQTYYNAGQACVDYLIRHLHVSGRFDYVFDPRTGKSGNDYNLLRHAGTLYALFQWYRLTGTQPPRKLLDKGVDYLETFIESHPTVRYLSAVAVNGEAKLGGAGLALLMYTERQALTGKTGDLRLMRQLAEFIIWTQEPSGRFPSIYVLQERRFTDFYSVYYPGEAMLGLLRLYRVDPDPRWLQAVINGARYLLLDPVMHGMVRGHNHWFVTTLSEYLTLAYDDEFYRELWKIADATINSIPRRIRKRGSSASMATVGETAVAGLLAELGLQRSARIRYLSDAIDTVLEYCLSLQVKPGQYAIGAGVGGIMKSAARRGIRIDYVQHTLQVISGCLMADAMKAVRAFAV